MVDCMITAVAWRHGAALLAQERVGKDGRRVNIDIAQSSQEKHEQN